MRYSIGRYLKKMHPEPASLTGLKLHVIKQGARWNEHLALGSTSGFPDPNPLSVECLHGPVPAAPHPSKLWLPLLLLQGFFYKPTLPLSALLHATHNNTLHSFSPK